MVINKCINLFSFHISYLDAMEQKNPTCAPTREEPMKLDLSDLSEEDNVMCICYATVKYILTLY